MARRCERSERGCQIGRNAYKLSGHGHVRRMKLSWWPSLSAYRMVIPFTVRNRICMTSFAGMLMMFLLLIEPGSKTIILAWMAGAWHLLRDRTDRSVIAVSPTEFANWLACFQACQKHDRQHFYFH